METSNDSLYCPKCNAELVENASFCSECGSKLNWLSRTLSMGKRLRKRGQVKLDSYKMRMDKEISSYLRKMDNGEGISIGTVVIPDSRTAGVRNAMKSFQDRYLDGDASQEADYDIWFSELSQRVEEHNCIVCFTKWDDTNLGEIVVCPHCNSGGHRAHISDWIKSKKYCPLCRERVTFREYIVLK